MKTKITILILLIGTGIQAQISMQNHPWILGPIQFIFKSSNLGTPAMIGSPGANQTYDFSSFIANDSFAFDLLSVSGFHHASSFPNSNVYSLEKTGSQDSTGPDSLWRFYSGTSGSFMANAIGARMKPDMGAVFIAAPYSFGNDTMLASFMNYGYHGSFDYGFFVLGPGGPNDTMHQEITHKTMDVDGWGQMNVQGRSYEVLRFKTIEITLTKDGPNRNLDTQCNYSFFSNLIPGEMARIHMSSDWNNIQYLMVADIPANMGVLTPCSNSSFSLYPNPAQNELFIQMKEIGPGCSYRILDLSGRCISTGQVTMANQKMDLNLLERGIYVMEINDLRGTTHQTSFLKN